MYLTRHQTPDGPGWALDGALLPRGTTLSSLLELPLATIGAILPALPLGPPAAGALLPPIEPAQEVWASGVTYLRSRDARQAESSVGDVYAKVYEAERPELFFKALGWRVVGDGAPVRIRADSTWDVPEPEVVLVVNRDLEIAGYCAGNDMSSRSIEGENPLYLPQAKIYNRSCALGPGIVIGADVLPDELPVRLEIARDGTMVFQGETSTARMKRRFAELVAYLGRELDFPNGAFLMTGTGIVPPDTFTLRHGDQVQISVGDLTLANEVHGER
jgi:2-dehydro-3-deoxy-D-arabinonate dehydratase